MSKRLIAIGITLSLIAPSGCGGTGGAKVLKEAQPLQITEPLGAANNQQTTATLDWVIIRDGPGAWAKNADWDEYLLRVNNRSDQDITVTNIIVVDSLDTQIAPEPGRKQLVKRSKDTVRRYKGSGLKVKAGQGAGTMLAAGAAVTAVAAGAAAGTALGSALYGAGAAAAGVVVLGPALAVGGIIRGVNNSKVNEVVEQRQTTLPVEIPAGAEIGLDIFFPLAPSPRRVELKYTDAADEHVLVIDTSVVLDGLHLEADAD